MRGFAFERKAVLGFQKGLLVGIVWEGGGFCGVCGFSGEMNREGKGLGKVGVNGVY